MRGRAVAVVFGWALLLVVLWIVGVVVAPDGGDRCANQGFGCPEDVEFTLFVAGFVVGLPVIGASLLVSVIAVLLVYHRNPDARRPVLVGTGIFWVCVVLGIAVYVVAGRG
ncbi:hypothetical protein OG394_36940 [Kribbella sp. NBC_01245]|uniref:hypothetical protein n=1 Tax=Kribbella sp. NBC_01245 TaxID=2903578 RepID=UPI002E298863|nr:hypothetical protein [Kribbella sp. NBC_01245]